MEGGSHEDKDGKRKLHVVFTCQRAKQSENCFRVGWESNSRDEWLKVLVRESMKIVLRCIEHKLLHRYLAPKQWEFLSVHWSWIE